MSGLPGTVTCAFGAALGPAVGQGSRSGFARVCGRPAFLIGQDGAQATATFTSSDFDPAKIAVVLNSLISVGMLGSYEHDGDSLTLKWPIGATPPPNPYAGWHSKQAENVPFGPHNPALTAEQTTAAFVDLVLYNVCQCKVPLPAQKQS
jgi:hypothetical protein